LKDNAQGLSAAVDGYDVFGYKGYSHYFYLPIGADILFQTNSRYSLESNLEYDHLIDGYQVDKLGIFPGFNNISMEQGKGNGLKGSLRFNLYFKDYTAFVEGFYRYWNIGPSKAKSVVSGEPSIYENEPKNNTEEFGLRVGLQV